MEGYKKINNQFEFDIKTGTQHSLLRVIFIYFSQSDCCYTKLY